MKLVSLLALAAATLSTPACVFVVDATGVHSHAAWEDDWYGDSSGTRYQGSGTAAMAEFELAGFHAVALGGSMQARVHVGAPTRVTATGDDNLLEHLRVEVEDGVLRIGWKPGSYRTRVAMVFDITAPALDGLEIAGSGDASIDGLAAGALRLTISGSGSVTARGAVDQLSASVAGSGDMRLFDLVARSASVSVAGSGDVRVHATESLRVDIAGSGDVRYRGSAQVTRSIAGSGSVERD